MMCSIPSGFFSLTARAWAVRTAFLIYCSRLARYPKQHITAQGTYLSTVEIAPSKPIIIIVRELFDLDAATDSLDLTEECFPDAVFGLGGKVTIAERNMDAGLEGRIEGFDAIGGQEEYTLEVFKKSKEDADKGISANVLGLASLCTYVLVEVSLRFSR